MTTSLELSTSTIDDLRKLVREHPDFPPLLEQSLVAAKEEASAKLKPALFEALTWPTTYDSYLGFLEEFARWIPRQSEGPAWTGDPTGQQEPLDRLCHFYWLINQKQGGGDTAVVQDIPWFKSWLVGFAGDWGSYLDTPASFSDETLKTFLDRSPKYCVQDSLLPDRRPNEPSGWFTFNQFFARELNPGLRPIANPRDNKTITVPADCTYKATYPINEDLSVGPVTIKRTHTFGNIADLLDGSPYATRFAGGTFVHYFLSPFSYHRFHTPVAGTVKEARTIQGSVYLDVTINEEDGLFDAPDGAEGGYEFTQARGAIVIDTEGSPEGDIGLVAAIPVGMAQVSSVVMTMTEGATVPKGEEFGYFQFGGSDIVVLIEKPRAGEQLTINEDEEYRHYGTPMATFSP
ncbi:phosphatidylserine decarboxylase [Saccharothrix xinjiangensis]|uniref:Phosphatidylserine decarboxylase n=1 Tax=Saccharothrix xinjiangensis TaxID=204798 RepID=A0ABV9XV13_9PSEU